MISEKFSFKEFLEDQGQFAPHTIPYMIKRVYDCYRHLDCSTEEGLTVEQKKSFLDHLARTHEDWQVKQTDTALRLYHFFLTRHEHPPEAVPMPETWQKLQGKIVMAMLIYGCSLRLRACLRHSFATHLLKQG